MINQQKTILQGTLHFGSEKSFLRAKRMYEGRLETYYKNILIFKETENFNELRYTFEVPRTVVNATDKSWRNTKDAMTFLGQFAICGKLEAYQTENGKILQKEIVVPNNDKQPVRDYWKSKLLFEKGNFQDATTAAEFALQGYEKHTQALEVLGRIQKKAGNMEAALDFFTKALKSDNKTYTAYFFRGKIFFQMEEYEKALADFDNALKHSLAVLDIHWRSRLEKARCLIELGTHESARKELGFFITKQFEAQSDNFPRKREAYLLLGRSYLDTDEQDKALEAFNLALDYKEGENHITTAECHYFRGLAKKENGLESFTEDFAKASAMGYAIK